MQGYASLPRESVEGKSLVFTKGYCAANRDHPEDPMLDFDDGLDEIIRPRIAAGTIALKPRDDRKYRMGMPIVGESTIEVPLGVTDYLLSRADLDAGREELEALHRLGVEHHGDPYAFIQCALGADVLPIIDGRVLLGARALDPLEGKIHALGSFVDYQGDPERLDIAAGLDERFEAEMGIYDDDYRGNLEFTGVVSSPNGNGDNALLFTQRLSVDPEFIEKEIWKRETDPEGRDHRELGLYDWEGVQRLLRQPDNLVFTTLRQLKELRPEDLRR